MKSAIQPPDHSKMGRVYRLGKEALRELSDFLGVG